MIKPTPSFKDNLALLPAIDGVAAIEVLDASGTVVDTIPNQPGKKGSVAVYQYLHQVFGTLNADAATHGMAVFAEHTADAEARPGAHPNIDRLMVIANGGAPMTVRIIAE